MSLRFLIVVFAFFFPSINALQKKTVFVKQRIRSTTDKCLVGHVFKTTAGARDPQHCLSDCWAVSDRCQSFNFLVDSGTCELNEASNLTNPQDLIDKPRVVYMTNPLFARKKVPEMMRHNLETTMVEDPCLSNPCRNGGTCDRDVKLGFRCHGCNKGFYGQRCEERQDICESKPCFEGTCKSTSYRAWCICNYPDLVKGEWCGEAATQNYQFNFSKANTYPTLREQRRLKEFSLWFWFKTTENTSYFLSYVPDKLSEPESLSLWRNGTTVYVRLLTFRTYAYDFPHSYPLNDNRWHSIVLTYDAGKVCLYLDGLKHHMENHNGRTYYNLAGEVRLGYYQDNSGTEHYFQGSIGSVDLYYSCMIPTFVTYYISGGNCIPTKTGYWDKVWKGFQMASVPIRDCGSREIVNSCPAKKFDSGKSALRRLEKSISPPVNLTAFTISFYVESEFYPINPYQIACYGDDGRNCALSVVIHANMTLEISLVSTRVEVNLVPIFANRQHHMVITWDNQDGVLEILKDDVLQSRVINVEKNQTIPGQSRLMVGGNDVLQMNYNGYLWEFNLWDKVLPRWWLRTFTSTPGNSKGNVVAWRDLVSKGDESAIVSEYRRFIENYGSREVIEFRSSGPDDYLKSKSYADSLNAFTFVIWLKPLKLPAVILRHKSRYTENIVLSIDNHTKYFLTMLRENISIIQTIPEDFIGRWHFLSVTWSTSGTLESNVDGLYYLHSTTFNENQSVDGNKAEWYIGGGEGFLGFVTGANVWTRALPLEAIHAMARGGSNVVSQRLLEPYWYNFYNSKTIWNVRVAPTDVNHVYLPKYNTQLAMDNYCNVHSDPLACLGKKYYARLGYNGGRAWGCFCENQLSHDHNFKHGSVGSYDHSDELAKGVFEW